MTINEGFVSLNEILFQYLILMNYNPLPAIVLCWQKVGGGINWTWNRDFFSFFFSCYVKIKLVAFTSNVDGSRKFVHITDNLVVERHKNYLPFFYVFFLDLTTFISQWEILKRWCAKILTWYWKMNATLHDKKEKNKLFEF